MLAQGRRQVQQPGLEADGARIGDPLHDEVVRVLQQRQDAGVGAGRRAIEGAGRAAAQELMGPLLVVFLAEPVEGSLLRGEGRPGG